MVAILLRVVLSVKSSMSDFGRPAVSQHTDDQEEGPSTAVKAQIRNPSTQEAGARQPAWLRKLTKTWVEGGCGTGKKAGDWGLGRTQQPRLGYSSASVWLSSP